MFKKIVSAKKFWLSVLLLDLAFVIFYNLIRVFFEFHFSFEKFYMGNLENGRWIATLVSSLVGGLIYGFIVVYFRYYRRFKEEKR